MQICADWPNNGRMKESPLIKAIEDFASKRGIAPKTVCRYATNQHKTYERILRGSASMNTVERVRAYLRSGGAE